MNNDLERVLDEIEQLTSRCWHFERFAGKKLTWPSRGIHPARTRRAT